MTMNESDPKSLLLTNHGSTLTPSQLRMRAHFLATGFNPFDAEMTPEQAAESKRATAPLIEEANRLEQRKAEGRQVPTVGVCFSHS